MADVDFYPDTIPFRLTGQSIPPGDGDGMIPGGMDIGMSPLNYWRQVQLRKMEMRTWQDSTMKRARTREDEFEDELDGQGGDGETPKTGRKKY